MTKTNLIPHFVDQSPFSRRTHAKANAARWRLGAINFPIRLCCFENNSRRLSDLSTREVAALLGGFRNAFAIPAT
jgi:hypothetical protein